MLRRERCRARMLVDMTTERHEDLRVPASLPTVLIRFGALVAILVAAASSAWVAVFARDVVVGLGQDPIPSGTFVVDVLWASAVFALLSGAADRWPCGARGSPYAVARAPGSSPPWGRRRLATVAPAAAGLGVGLAGRLSRSPRAPSMAG